MAERLDDAAPRREAPTADMTSSLVVRVRAGDPRAGALLDELYRDALVRFCWGYLGRMEEAEDAVQDICCKVLETRIVPDAFRPWLYKIARNHCLNLRRGRARRKDDRDLPSASQLREALTGQLTRLVRDEQKARLEELVRALPETEREILRLRYVEGLSRPEIAEVLDLDESVVKSRLFEGLQRLREQTSGETG
jgi:RNA polymerase sigma-70 factor (ECF subfamily)